MLIAARVLGGIGVGVASNVAPLYISEIAPARIRGRLVTFYQLAITIGILLAFLSNAGLHEYANTHQAVAAAGIWPLVFIQEAWRGMFGVGVFPSLLFLFGLFLVPESPRWLLQQGSREGVLTVLAKINGPQTAASDMAAIRQTLGQESGSYRDLLRPGMRKALLIGILLPLFSQFSGINDILYYGPRILTDAGLSLSNALDRKHVV